MTLPGDFLIEMAHKYGLSQKQEDAFVLLFSTDKSRVKISEQLYISPTTFGTRMTEVYTKFSINGTGPVKERKLLDFLTTEYRKSKASVSPSVNLSENDLKELVQEVRSYCREMIQNQCGTMRSLTMSQPVDVSDLYTNVNILEKIPSHRRREIDELLQDFNSKKKL